MNESKKKDMKPIIPTAGPGKWKSKRVHMWAMAYRKSPFFPDKFFAVFGKTKKQAGQVLQEYCPVTKVKYDLLKKVTVSAGWK